jgi:F-actin-capping protein subunit alpha
VIISEAGRVAGEDERFRDPRSKTTFKFDHLRLVRQTLKPSGMAQLENHGSYVQEASDAQSYEPDEAAEPFRYALMTQTLNC